MKRISMIALAIALALSLTACRRNKNRQTEPTTRATTPTTATTETARPTTAPTVAPSTEMTMPEVTDNIGDHDNGIIGDDATSETAAHPTDTTDMTDATQPRNRVRTPGTTGGKS